MASTYTLNNGIELIGTGEQSGTWGDTTNTNLELLDTALDGQVTVTLPSAGTSGSPNTLSISDGAASDGRNRMVIFNDGGDLGATAYVQLTPNDAEKIIYIRNDLAGSRSIILFQGTYNASNDYELPAGNTAIIYFDGAGAGAVAANVFNNAHFDAMNIVGNADVGGTLSVTGAVDLSSSLAVDTITEKTAAAGVTIDSVLLKDDVVNATDIETSNISANDGTAAGTIADSTGLVTITSFKSDSVDIGGGAIDDTPIGATTRAAGFFTSLEASTNSTLGTDTSNTLAINSEIHSNLLFDDNTYTIGASGANRPASIYISSTYHGQQASLGSNASSNTGPPANGVVISAPGATSGYYSAALEFDINGGGGNARMYTQRLGGAGGIFYLDTDNTSAVYYKRLVINQDGEQYWYNNNATDDSIAMQLVSKALTVNGTISSNHTDGLISLNGTSGAVYANIRAYAGNDGYLMFTENTVADRWSIGVEASDSVLYFRNGNYSSATAVMKLSTAGGMTLGDTSLGAQSMLTIRARATAAALGSTLEISNIDAQGQNTFYGAVGDIDLRSSSSFANNSANAHLSLRRLAWKSASGSSSDLTEGVGLWIGGYYDSSGTGLPIYLGGYQYSSDNPDVQIKGGKVSIGVSPQSWSWPDGTTRTLDFQSDNAITSYNGTLYMSSNWYYNQGAGGEKYSDNGTAGRHYQSGGDFYVDSAPNNTSGAGAGLTWTNRFKVETSGLTKINSTSAGGTGNTLIVGFGNTINNAITVVNTGDQNYAGIKISNWDGATTTQGPRIAFDNSGYGEWFIGSTNNADYFDITDAWATNTYLRVDNVGRLLVDRSTHNSRLGSNVQSQIGAMGIISLGIGSTATDTGIDINQADGGNSMLMIVSRNTGAGTATASGMYFIKFYYDGNNAPAVSHVAQDNFITFGVSGSNTLTVANPGAGNCGGIFISCR